MAHYFTGNQNEAAALLGSIIRKDRFYFQAYVTLAAIYKESGNYNDAEKTIDRMNAAEDKLRRKNQKTVENNVSDRQQTTRKTTRKSSLGLSCSFRLPCMPYHPIHTIKKHRRRCAIWEIQHSVLRARK